MKNKLFTIFIFLMVLGHTLGQGGVVFGVIRDIDTGAGIDFVTVFVDGTSVPTESDINGQYRIEVTENQRATIKFSRLGYTDLSIKVEAMKSGQKRNINVKMVPKSTELEIVVRAGKIEDVGMVREEVTELKILPTASGNFESILPHIALGVKAGSLFHQGYQGARFSFGYPACPNLEDQTKLFEFSLRSDSKTIRLVIFMLSLIIISLIVGRHFAGISYKRSMKTEIDVVK